MTSHGKNAQRRLAEEERRRRKQKIEAINDCFEKIQRNVKDGVKVTAEYNDKYDGKKFD